VGGAPRAGDGQAPSVVVNEDAPTRWASSWTSSMERWRW
jgi:hypothetical protein